MPNELREPTYLVLTALAAGRRHGYALIKDVQELSGDRVTLRAGTLYGMLDRLVDEGLVGPDGEEVVDGRLRRYYRLTDTGASELQAAAERMAMSAKVALTRLAASQRPTSRRSPTASPA
jgi:DNA-binding PadR family transcriptional regulator